MRQLRDVLRLRLEAGLSFRQISRGTKISVGACQQVCKKAETLGLTWPLPDDMDDGKLARLFYPTADVSASKCFHVPDWRYIHQELSKKMVTKQLLWEEYTQQYPNRCYSYSQFCDLYRAFAKTLKRSMRQVHKAGEKCFLDYCGPTLPIVNPNTGEIHEAAVFVGVLGASSYTYAEATRTQRLPDWLGSQVRMFDYFGGTPEVLVPDNLKSAVNRACRYDPEVNPSYQQFAEHYGVAILPTRPYKPKDKSKVEVGVQVVERWILARLRKHTFFSLQEANQCIRVLLDDLNKRPFKQLPGSRREAFEKLDQPILKPLPVNLYQFIDIKPVKVNIDYHVSYDKHLYSVPHQYVGETLEIHATDNLVIVYFHQLSVASHPRSYTSGMTTQPAHMPEKHLKHHQCTPGSLKNRAQAMGADVLQWVTSQLERKTFPAQAFRVCIGLLALAQHYPVERIDRACRIANREKLYQLKQVKAILKSNRDRLPEQVSLSIDLPQDHENIRGPKSFH